MSQSCVDRRSAAIRTGFTLVELLVVIAIIGVLVALLLPAVQAAREAARRSSCQNNLHQTSLGIMNFESANKEFPACFEPGISGPGSATNLMHSWAPYILPFIEQQSLHSQYRFDKWWGDPTTNALITRDQRSSQDIVMLLCPSTPKLIKGRSDYAAICGPGYPSPHPLNANEGWKRGQNWSQGVLVAISPITSAGVDTYDNDRVRIGQITDGTSNTIMLGECAGRDVAAEQIPKPEERGPAQLLALWANGDHSFAHHYALNITPLDELYSDHPGGLHLANADASVRYISESTDKTVIDRLTTRDGGELTNGEY